jgi:hypothetical protein
MSNNNGIPNVLSVASSARRTISPRYRNRNSSIEDELIVLQERLAQVEKNGQRTEELLKKQIELNQAYEEKLTILQANYCSTNKSNKKSSRRPSFHGCQKDQNALTVNHYNMLINASPYKCINVCFTILYT